MKERRTPNAKPERAYVGLHDLFDRLPPTSPPFPPPPKSIKRATRSAVIKDRPTRTAGEGKDTVEKGGKEGHRLRVLPSALLPRRYRSAREGQPARGLRNAPACPPALLRERVRERENERESASEEKTERERERERRAESSPDLAKADEERDLAQGVSPRQPPSFVRSSARCCLFHAARPPPSLLLHGGKKRDLRSETEPKTGRKKRKRKTPDSAPYSGYAPACQGQGWNSGYFSFSSSSALSFLLPF